MSSDPLSLLETPRLRLRSFLDSDLEDYYAQVYGDDVVMRYLPGGKARTREQTRAVLDFAVAHGQQHGFTLWAVIRQADGQFIGHCGLVYLRDSPDEVELAYAFGQPFWGQGYANEAAAAALRYGFEVGRLKTILALAEPENIASQRVMAKIGMTYQGITERYYQHALVLYRADAP
ncbi:MAG: GNAT family N-acetyltransferase [Anaerolineae bacterium]|nr:GNAT family N-acetyltransferase [Anaerolineae bacterium]